MGEKGTVGEREEWREGMSEREGREGESKRNMTLEWHCLHLYNG